MKTGTLTAAVLILAMVDAALADQDRFAWRYDLRETPTAPVVRLALQPEQIAELHRSDARDWQMIDAQGRPVPAIMLPASALIESRLETTELDFQQSLADDPEQPSSPLSLDIERGLTRVLIQAPDSRRPPDDGRLIFEALIAAPQRLDPARRGWLDLHMQADQRLRLDCRFGDAEAEHAGIDRFVFQEIGDARPRRYQGRESVNPLPAAWHLSCFAGQAVPGLSLVRAVLEEERRVDHRRHQLISPAETDLHDNGAVLEFSLPGPFQVSALSMRSEQPGVFSQLQLLSRAGPDQPWRDRGRMTLSTLNGESDPLTTLAAPVRERYWRVIATPPLPNIPEIEVQVQVDEIAFLAQGEGPWQLLIGSLEPGDGHMLPDVLSDLSQRQGPAWDWNEIALAERREAAGPAALRLPPEPVPWQRYLLWVILLGACLMVLTLAVRLLRSG